LTNSVTDPVSGQPESKQIPVALRKINVPQWLAIATPLDLRISSRTCLFFTRRPIESGYRFDLALPESQSLTQLKQWLVALVSEQAIDMTQDSSIDWIEMDGTRSESNRLLLTINGQPQVIASTDSCRQNLLNVTRSLSSLGATQADDQPTEVNWRVLSMDPVDSHAGPSVCTCFEVSQQSIESAITGGANTVEALGKKLGCGTNCGSCIPELKALLR